MDPLDDFEELVDSDRNGRCSGIRPAQNSRYVSVGDLICGKYLVEKVLGVGGMAFVLSARHIELDEHFALKFLNAEFLQEKAIVERFMREAKAACKIRNQHVAHVHDVGSHAGAPFLVMEHLTGQDLADVLADQGALPIQEAAEYILQACEALAVAHSHGIVHRDIKPENLFLVGHDGPRTLKLLDFGISKMPVGCSTLTGHLSLGTPHYMSPEQIRSTAGADPRSDLWSLGTVLYELLTGAHAFDGESGTEICAAVLETEPVPIRVRRPEVPEALCKIVEKCIEKERSQRWENAAELAHALLPFAPSRSIASAERCASVTRLSSATPLAGTKIVPMLSSMPPARRVRTPESQRAFLAPAAPTPDVLASPKLLARVPKATVLFSLAFAALGGYSLYAARTGAASVTTANRSESAIALASANNPPIPRLNTTKPATESVQVTTKQHLPALPNLAKNRKMLPVSVHPLPAHTASASPVAAPAPAASTQVAASVGTGTQLAPPASTGTRIELGY